jgi:flagellin FlaB
MNLIRKGHRQSHRGVIGVESAIVMIAFVIVAAALAFVVLNMGFSTTQKAKTTIVSGLSEASNALEVSGTIFGSGDTTNNKLKMLAVPIKVTTGGESIDLSASTASVKYLSNSITYDNIYLGTLTATADDTDGSADGQWRTLSAATTDADTKYSGLDSNPITGGAPSNTKAFIYWTTNTSGSQNSILDQGEHAVLAIAYSNTDRPSSLDKVRTEILIPTGAALTVERQVPSVTTSFVDLG